MISASVRPSSSRRKITKDQISPLFWRNMLISVGVDALLSLTATLSARRYHELMNRVHLLQHDGE